MKSKIKKVKLSHDIPKEIQQEIQLVDTKINSVKDYLAITTRLQPLQLDALIDTKIKNKPLQLVNMMDNTDITPSQTQKIPFLPKIKHAKSWTVKQLPIDLQRYHHIIMCSYLTIYRFQIYQPLHQLWSKYIEELLTPILDQKDVILSRLTKADYHGAIMTINRSTCTSLIGLTGIVLHESAHMFSLVCTDDKARSIPKKGTIFSITWGKMIFRLYGNHLIMAPAERATRKLKPKNTIEINH